LIEHPTITGIIPARFQSSRFPGKPLVDILGKSMILRVYEQANKVKGLSQVVVATDDERIYNEITHHGGQAIMTSDTHRNGTERCAEVADRIPSDYYLNIQGDEPYIHPTSIESLISILDGSVELGTLIKKIDQPDQLEDPTTMKVIQNSKGEAIYFSRQCVPFVRDHDKSTWLKQFDYYKHIGIYAYRSDVLKEIVKLSPTPLELAESLEQLRWLENGYSIKLAETDSESMSIDTPEDLDKLITMINA
jgi:3-deoxy-manno-octulosonate cytidylyltransferase (CMP-KDO synthetase)